MDHVRVVHWKLPGRPGASAYGQSPQAIRYGHGTVPFCVAEAETGGPQETRPRVLVCSGVHDWCTLGGAVMLNAAAVAPVKPARRHYV